MYINRSTAKVLQIFAGHITESFTLREVARRLKMHVSLTHRAIQPLIENHMIQQDKHKNLVLNYKTHHETLAFVEYLRRDDLLSKRKFKDINLFAEEIVHKIKEDSFVLLVFGSTVESDKPRDIDILLIVDSTDKVEFHEKFLHNIASDYDLPFEERVIGFESVYEMLSKREEKNVMNELLNKHIILYGAELFYRLIQRGRS
ncbi:MAG: helix-turn-helix domain-containing protein [DPANN group archaeon]|nr:helix-turn-helix domain-containing protein [DPANN group archaeon]